MSIPDSKRSLSVFFRIALIVGAASMAVALSLFSYLGTFTRYLADDYCETVLVRGGLLQTLIRRYETVSDRFTNQLFVGLLEFLSPHNVQFIPAVMILFWVAALTWLVFETRRMVGLRWNFLLDFFLAASLAFFCVLEAPNRFQTFYWRSAMSTHFAPLVYLTAFAAFLLIIARNNEGRFPAFWIGPLCLVIAFFGGGFSEPPDAVLIVASSLALAAVWLWEKGPRRRPALMLLGWTLGGGLLALVVLMAAPGNAFRFHPDRPDLVGLIYKTFLTTVQFIFDSLSTLPVPVFVSIVIPFLLFYGLFAASPALHPSKKRMVWIVTAAAPVLAFGLMAAGFAPSVYGQAFPSERARFIGCLLMTVALMFEGACFGILLAQWKMRWSSTAITLAMILLALSAVYPLRAAWDVMQQKSPFYSRWSTRWDNRQAQILALKAKGVQDIVTFQLISIEGIGELGPDPKSWINMCAANYYGINSISAP
jgi:Family of unknown function (DUF6056)